MEDQVQLLTIPLVGDGDAVAPAHAREFVRPAGRGQPGVQRVKVGLRDVDVEGTDVVHGFDAMHESGQFLTAVHRGETRNPGVRLA